MAKTVSIGAQTRKPYANTAAPSIDLFGALLMLDDIPPEECKSRPLSSIAPSPYQSEQTPHSIPSKMILRDNFPSAAICTMRG